MAQFPWSPSLAFFWPALVAASAQAVAQRCTEIALGTSPRAGAPPAAAKGQRWATRNKVVLALPSVRLRAFARAPTGRATLICAPFALHGASLADFAPGHSLVGALRHSGLRRLFITEWLSATPDDARRRIDDYLADLNILVDELAPPVNLVGLCQGGWMALLYAARFPGKAHRLVLAGAPIDLDAAVSTLTRLARGLPLTSFAALVREGGGCLRGGRMLAEWGWADPEPALIRALLQVPEHEDSPRLRELEERFRAWNAFTVDLPGVYYLEVVDRLFKHNELAAGRFVALGKRIDLAQLTAPLFLIAAEDDELVVPEQEFAVMRRVGTPPEQIRTTLVPGRHLSLFMGARTLRQAWPEAARWLAAPEPFGAGQAA